MTAGAWLLLAVAAVAAVIDWSAVWSDAPNARLVERVAKPAVLIALMGVALTPPANPSVQPWLLIALLGSLAGDVLLLPPGRLTAGLVAFLLGHLAYIAAFWQFPGSEAWLLLGVVSALLVIATIGRTLVRAATRSGMGIPVALYLGVISLMAVSATRTGIPAAVLGAWLFVASDSMLGWGQFAAPESGGGDRGDSRLRLGVIVTYHAAQVLLVLALLSAS
jgi:uncharacterized membrane protein YhhN